MEDNQERPTVKDRS